MCLVDLKSQKEYVNQQKLRKSSFNNILSAQITFYPKVYCI